MLFFKGHQKHYIQPQLAGVDDQEKYSSNTDSAEISKVRMVMHELQNINSEIEGIVSTEFMFLLLEQAQKTESVISGVQEYISTLSNLVEEENKVINEFVYLVNFLSDCNNSLILNANSMEEITFLLHNLVSDGIMIQNGTSEILKIVDGIKSLNSNVNLLSLNSSIEAAKAGDAGKGFAVVSVEMKKLSEATKKSVDGIRGITENYTEKIETIVNSIEICCSKVDEKSQDVIQIQGKASGIINDIVKAAHTLTDTKNRLENEVGRSRETYEKVANLSKTFEIMTDVVMKISDKVEMQKNKIDSFMQTLN